MQLIAQSQLNWTRLVRQHPEQVNAFLRQSVGIGAGVKRVDPAININGLRRLIREHKSAHDTCTYFWFIWTTGAVWGTYKWGDGTYWGATGDDTVGIVCGEKQWSTFGYM